MCELYNIRIKPESILCSLVIIRVFIDDEMISNRFGRHNHLDAQRLC